MRTSDALTQRALPMRALIAAATLVAVAALAIGAGSITALGGMRLALVMVGAPVVLALLVLAVRKFETAVMFLPLAALAVPVDLPTGTFSRVPAALALTILLCVIWVASMALRSRFALTPSVLNRPMLAFGVICCASFAWGTIFRDPVVRTDMFRNFPVVQAASLITFLASIGAALLIGNFAQTEGRLKFIVGCFVALGALMTAAQLLKLPQQVLNDRGLWSLWTVVPAFCLAVALPKLRWQWRALLLALVVANIYQTMMLNQFWKSGWVPTLAALYVAVLMRSRRWFVVMVLISLAVGYREREFLAQMTQAEMLEGADQRIGMWEINARIVGDHWLLGTGPAGYAVYYMNYYPNDARSTHNNYLDILAQFGVLGMGAWIWLSVAATVEGARLYRSLAPGFLKALTMIVISGWLGALGSMLLGDWLLPFAYNQTITGYKYTVYTWLFLGMLISIRAIRGRTVDAVPVEEPLV